MNTIQRNALLAILLCAMPALATEWQADFANRTVAAFTAVAPMPQLSAEHPEATLNDGYAIQALVVKQLLAGKKPAGFKAAVIAAPGQKALGVEGPLAGVIPPGGVLCACEAVTIDLGEDPARNIETEVGYLIGTAITAPIADIATLQKHIKIVLAMIEVPGGPVETTGPPTAADLAAWNINAKLFIAGDYKAPEKIDVDSVTVTLKRDGETVNTGHGADAAGGQWETLRKTINTLVALGYTFEPDQFISNGALGKIVKAEPGSYEADFGPLGAVVFDVVAAK
jgi:2-keto-4-pentenoate hydratase